MPVRVRLHIHGQVQGVGFRFYARHEADRLGLGGWVRNCPDGSVEAVAEGEEAAVERFVAWAQQGPSSAWVEHVDVERETPAGEPAGFRIRGS